MIFAFSSYDCY